MKQGAFIYYIKNKKHGIVKGLIVTTSILLILFIVVSSSLHNRIVRNLMVAAQNKFSDVCNQAFDAVAQKLNINYDDVVIISKDNNGKIISLSVNSIIINRIKTMLDREIDDILLKNGRFSFSIPIGTIIGNEFTSGRGPRIKFDYDLFCSISTDFESNFSSCGINQTRHQIILNVCSDLSTASPFATRQKIDNLQYLLCETVLAGDVPQSYSNININR
ncbi:MAG: hypothetical protein KBS41_05115 [Oscillospiraceae bacterium]|nr:hypothetical protein [Candidatus Equicaccousia limihippi]